MHPPELRATTTELIGPRLDRLQRIAALAGLAGLGLSLPELALNPAGFFQSYLGAYLFWIGITSGSLALLMLHHIVGGGWGFLIRRLLEAATRLFPAMLLLFAPVVVGLLFFGLYEWALPRAAHDPILREKSAYLNIPFFLARTGLYFVVWGLLARFLNRWGAVQDVREDPAIARRLNLLGAGGLVAYVLTTTFASIDWVMSLTPHWYSTIFGMLLVVSQGLSALAFAIAVIPSLAGDLPLIRAVPAGYFRDLGNLLLAFVLLWAYMAFSQYLIVWSGNLLDEIPWYLDRTRGRWSVVPAILMILHFALPFLVLLLGSDIKRTPRKLGNVAGLVLGMRLLDLFWWVQPTFRPAFSIDAADVGAPLLIGGIWLWLWARELRDRPVVPLYDPRMKSALEEAVRD